MSDADGSRRASMGVRTRERVRRGSERMGGRIVRSLGEPALFAITLSAIVSAIFLSLGVVAEDALGLTPLVYLVAGVFFMITMATYVEGSSLHIERGGASTFARYAFDELWSFIAGWAILLDYIIVMAIGAVVITDYLAVFWSELDEGGLEVVFAGVALLFVAVANVRGLSADRIVSVLRISLWSIGLLLVVTLIAYIQFFDATAITDSVELGQRPGWDQVIFAMGIATAGVIGVEAASGLAGEVRVGRRGLKRVVLATAAVSLLLLVGVSAAGLMAQPVVDGQTALGGRFIDSPVLGIVDAYEQDWLVDAASYVVAVSAALMLIVAMNGQMLGLARLAYSLATNRQIPSAAGRLSQRRGTPHVAIAVAALLAFGFAIPHDLSFLAGVFAFGAMISFAIAHLSVIVLRFREPDRPSAFRVPFSIPVRGGSVPIPAVIGLVISVAVWLSVLIYHEGGRIIGSTWVIVGVVLYTVYRRGQDKPLRKRFTIPAEALTDTADTVFGSILVPISGGVLDDDIVGTAGRLAAEHADEGEGGAVVEALYVFEIPMSLPIDARVSEERVKEAKRMLARAKEVGEEYEGVEVATAMVRGRSVGQAIVSEAKRRGVEAIVLAAEEPSRVLGGAILGGRGRARDRFVGDTTRYVVEKAPCKVILTAPPAGEEGTREGVLP